MQGISKELDTIVMPYEHNVTSATVKRNIAAMSVKQKLQIVARDAPELIEFCQDFDEKARVAT